MVERFEFEVDTTKANEFWQAEVAENLARKAEEDAAAASGVEPVETTPAVSTGSTSGSA
jgi:3-ketosteroid 9alpha-monooxygenase subunit A